MTHGTRMQHLHIALHPDAPPPAEAHREPEVAFSRDDVHLEGDRRRLAPELAKTGKVKEGRFPDEGRSRTRGESTIKARRENQGEGEGKDCELGCWGLAR